MVPITVPILEIAVGWGKMDGYEECHKGGLGN